MTQLVGTSRAIVVGNGAVGACGSGSVVASFVGTPLSGTPPLSVAFTDLTNATTSAWLWDFGDGGTATTQNPTYIYAAAGVYDVTLHATTGGGVVSVTRFGYVVVSAPHVIFDDFNRTASGGLGTPSSGTPAWANSTGAGFVIPSVNGTEALVQFTATERSMYCFFQNGFNGISTRFQQNQFVFTAQMQQSASTAFSDFVRFNWYDSGFTTALSAGMEFSTAGPYVALSTPNEGGAHVTIPSLVSGDWYNLKVDYLSGSYARLRFWKDIDPEPSTWLVNLVETYHPNLTTSPLFDWSNEMSTGSVRTRHYNFIDTNP